MSEEKDRAARKRHTFRVRLVSTLVLWGLVAAPAYFRISWIYLVMAAGVVLLSLAEFFRMIDLPGMRRRGYAVMVIAALYLTAIFLAGQETGGGGEKMGLFDALAVVAVALALFVMEFRHAPNPPVNIHRIALGVFGFVWIAFLFGFVLKLVISPQGNGLYYAVYLLVVTKFTDMGAYAVGSLIGKHPFMAHISPKKTWEGIGGAYLFALIGSLACVWLFGERMPLLGMRQGISMALVLGTAAIAGDLAESVVKRNLRTKDSGNVLPGIGGTLDLIDSICFTAPILYFYLVVIS